jgi:divalent metal cation (Fe/Co/Zn/Cd) transporter
MNRDVRNAMVGVVALSTVIAIARIIGGRLLCALAIEADGWHTLGDALALAVACGGLCFASARVYARLERGISAVLALLMLGVAVEVGLTAIGEPACAVDLAIAPLAIVIPTLALQLGLVHYQRRAAARTGSLLLEANAAHTRADVLVTTAILTGALLASLGLPILDRLAAFGVAIAIVGSALGLLRRSIRAHASIDDTVDK